MKKTLYIIIAALAALSLASCKMDLIPLSQGSSLSWYTTEQELDLAVNDFFVLGYWATPRQECERWTDNFTYRNTNRSKDILNGVLNGDHYEVDQTWQQNYKLVARANTLLENIHRAEEAGMSETKVNYYKAMARFCRACKYGELVFFFGDVPYMSGSMTIDQAERTGRMPKAEVIAKIYEDFDFAIEHLPLSYTGIQYPTKGTAYAMKARYALYFGDYKKAADAAKACMDLKKYSLDADYSHIFLQTTHMIPEKIFVIPRSIANSVVYDETTVKNTVPRVAGGYAAYNPSWELLAAYLCTDGLPIDESPLFNPRNPFENRDPRCTMTIVEHGTAHCGFIYDPRPDVMKVQKVATGEMVSNVDNRAVNQYASFNGLVLKKGVDESWIENYPKADPDYIIMRYADVLLMYAEAKIELDEIDNTVVDAINAVRARAYGVEPNTSFYPAVKAADQATMRKVVRLERRVELSFEDLRYYDIIRWKTAGKVLNKHNYIMLQPEDCMNQVVNKGLWFWGMTPDIDEEGDADFSKMCEAGYCMEGALRVFPERQYLFPIPSHEMDLSQNAMVNNPSY